MSSLGITDFSPYFRSRSADFACDDELMRRAYKLRYDVYCAECQFLPAADYLEGRESDEHDAQSAHFCAMNTQDSLVGYVRLVPADQHGNFPFQHHCGKLLEHVILPDHTKSAEISRLMVRQDYRRRAGDLLSGATVTAESADGPRERRDHSPQILLSLYREMYAHSLEHGIRYWYAAMERSLARVLMRMGFSFTQIGPQTDYYGPVAPYVADLRELEASVGSNNPALLSWMRRQQQDLVGI